MGLLVYPRQKTSDHLVPQFLVVFVLQVVSFQQRILTCFFQVLEIMPLNVGPPIQNIYPQMVLDPGRLDQVLDYFEQKLRSDTLFRSLQNFFHQLFIFLRGQQQ